tara:strand:- start:11 stop:883 length:873 start_codon:yes stop_codon:yes gene_type:complete
MRLALLGEQRAIDMGVGDDTRSSMQKNVEMYQKANDAVVAARAALETAETGGDPEEKELARHVLEQKLRDFRAIEVAMPRSTVVAAEMAAAAQQGKDSEAGATERIDLGVTASRILPVLKRSLALLENGIETGGEHSFKNATLRALGRQSADAAELEQNLMAAVLSQLKPTFGAAFTEKEGQMLANIKASWEKSTAGNIRLLQNAIMQHESELHSGISSAKLRGRWGQGAVDEMETNMDVKYGPIGWDMRADGVPFLLEQRSTAGGGAGAGDINALSEEQIEKLIIEGGG